MKVTYSLRATADLAMIGEYLAERNLGAALAVERRIHTVIELIAEFSASGQQVQSRPKVRVIPLGRYPYLIFYTVAEGELVVLHIRHTARKPIEFPDI